MAEEENLQKAAAGWKHIAAGMVGGNQNDFVFLVENYRRWSCCCWLPFGYGL